MKTHTLTINQTDYALVIHPSGQFDAAQQREIERLSELHKVKHFKTKTKAAEFVAGLIGCKTNTFMNRLSRKHDNWQKAVEVDPDNGKKAFGNFQVSPRGSIRA